MIKVTVLHNKTPYAVKVVWGNNSNQLDSGGYQHFENGGHPLPENSAGFEVEIIADDVQNPIASVFSFGDFIHVQYANGTQPMYVRSSLGGQLVVLTVAILLNADNTRTGIVIGDWEVAPHQ